MEIDQATYSRIIHDLSMEIYRTKKQIDVLKPPLFLSEEERGELWSRSKGIIEDMQNLSKTIGEINKQLYDSINWKSRHNMGKFRQDICEKCEYYINGPVNVPILGSAKFHEYRIEYRYRCTHQGNCAKYDEREED